jgi:hypothetical protein
MTTKLTSTVLLWLCTTLGGALGQRLKPCPDYNQLIAQRDLTDGRPKLFLLGGIAPLKRAADSSIEKQFSFLYQDLGCVRPVDDRCLREYSLVVFAYLDKKYGKDWRAKVRKDVLFLTTIPNRLTSSKSVI